jgi:hypothetical protein
MNEPRHDKPRYYLEDSRPVGGKPQWRRSQQAYASIEAARHALERGEVIWGPWTDRAWRKEVKDAVRGERVKRTKNWER